MNGLVLARGASNQSINYRSVVILGRATPVEDCREKLEALRLVVEPPGSRSTSPTWRARSLGSPSVSEIC